MLKILKWIPPVKEPYALYLIIRDQRTPLRFRLQALSIFAIILAYFISPVDIISDYLPILGWMDDLVIFPLGLNLIERFLPQEILLEKRVEAAKKVNRALLKVCLVAFVVFATWVLVLTAGVLVIASAIA